jgi:hypothetical protein
LVDPPVLGFAAPLPVLGAGVAGDAGADGAVVEGGVVLCVVVLSAPPPPLLLQAARPSSARAETDAIRSFFISSLLFAFHGKHPHCRWLQTKCGKRAGSFVTSKQSL